MKRMFNMNAVRVMGFVLAFSMIFSVAAFASDPTAWYGSGSATQYFIGTAEELAYFSYVVQTDYFDGKTVTLTADIDLAGIESELEKYTWMYLPTPVYDGKGWVPIAPFFGTFDGSGYVIKNLYINRPESDYQGLFGTTYLGTNREGVIKNLGVINVNVTGNIDVGGIAGRSNSLIENCFTTGSVTGAYDGIDYGGHYSGEYVGGISGSALNVRNSYSTADVTGRTIAGGIGGSFLSTLPDTTISEYLYSTGTITTLFPPSKTTGGMSGGIYSHVKYANNTLQNSVALNEAQVSGNTLDMTIHKRIAYEHLDNAATINFFNNYAWDGMVFKNLAGQTLLTMPGGTADSEDGESVRALEIFEGDVWGPDYANFPTDQWLIVRGKLPILKVFETRNGSRGGVSVQSGEIPQYILDEVDIEEPLVMTLWYDDENITVENVSKIAAVTLWMEIAEVEGAEPFFEGLNGFDVLDVKQNEDGLYGVILAYLAPGGQGFTTEGKADILQIIGAKGVLVVSARVSGYKADGSAYDLTYNLLPNDPTFVPHYDLNGDGIIDQLDLVIALKFYHAERGDANWELAKASDFDNNGIVNIKDYIHLLQHMEW